MARIIKRMIDLKVALHFILTFAHNKRISRGDILSGKVCLPYAFLRTMCSPMLQAWIRNN